ncbi:MAG: ADP-forming succinate--CoA ligase subunit beta [Candidatus Thermoplasmatota archaeon]
MKIHEHQAKGLLRKYGIPVPDGEVARTPEEARRIAERLGGRVVIKAQVHAGGRGKGGGIKSASGPEEAENAARQILGMRLVTHQTGAEGKVVRAVLVERASEPAGELYLGAVVDRERAQVVLIASTEGGVEIESVASRAPEKIIKTWVRPGLGLMPYQARQLCFKMGLQGQAFKDGTAIVSGLYNLFTGEDATLAEINPLTVTKDGRLLALDAKINIDDDAVFRHEAHAALRDLNEEDPLEVEASKHNLKYIKLTGSVGCMVNGAGLAMATMDLIKLCGAEPANFLDVGGTASAQGVENAFRILMSDKDVRCVLINIFGGIVRCDRVAEGVVEALKQIGTINLPVVVRLEGTNAKEGMEILKGSGLNFHVAESFHEAAAAAARLAGGA